MNNFFKIISISVLILSICATVSNAYYYDDYIHLNCCSDVFRDNLSEKDFNDETLNTSNLGGRYSYRDYYHINSDKIIFGDKKDLSVSYLKEKIKAFMKQSYLMDKERRGEDKNSGDTFEDYYKSNFLGEGGVDYIVRQSFNINKVNIEDLSNKDINKDITENSSSNDKNKGITENSSSNDKNNEFYKDNQYEKEILKEEVRYLDFLNTNDISFDSGSTLGFYDYNTYNIEQFLKNNNKPELIKIETKMRSEELYNYYSYLVDNLYRLASTRKVFLNVLTEQLSVNGNKKLGENKINTLEKKIKRKIIHLNGRYYLQI